MGKRTPWLQLKPEYRERLERKGITREQHESGVSLAGARGHANTPEHPREYDPNKYQQYNAERNRLTGLLRAKKEQLFGGRPRWNEERSNRYIRERPPSMAKLRWAVNIAEEEDLLDAIREDPAEYSFLGY
jgi:hypothetical protein